MEAPLIAKRIESKWLDEGYVRKAVIHINGNYGLFDKLEEFYVDNEKPDVRVDNPISKQELTLFKYLEWHREQLALPDYLSTHFTKKEKRRELTRSKPYNLLRHPHDREWEYPHTERNREDILAVFEKYERPIIVKPQGQHGYTFAVYLAECEDDVRILALNVGACSDIEVSLWTYENGLEVVYVENFFQSLKQLRLF